MADFPHILLRDARTSEGYVSTTTGGKKHTVPPRPERKTHGEKLLDDLQRAQKIAAARLKQDPTREGDPHSVNRSVTSKDMISTFVTNPSTVIEGRTK